MHIIWKNCVTFKKNILQSELVNSKDYDVTKLVNEKFWLTAPEDIYALFHLYTR